MPRGVREFVRIPTYSGSGWAARAISWVVVIMLVDVVVEITRRLLESMAVDAWVE